MTRHWWPANAPPEAAVAAGAVPAPASAARAVRPAAARTAASRRDGRKLNRMCCPFSPGIGRNDRTRHRVRKRFRNVFTTNLSEESSPGDNPEETIVPECSGTCFNGAMALADPTRDGNKRPSRVTIREVAELAGVSIATVSRVLNGRGDVSPETRELVSAIIREQGYSANRSARGLSAGRTGLVGGLVPPGLP